MSDKPKLKNLLSTAFNLLKNHYHDILKYTNSNGETNKFVCITSGGDIAVGNASDIGTNATEFYAGDHIRFYANRNDASNRATVIDLFREPSGSLRTVFRPNENSGAYIGTTSYRWNTAYFTNEITASDLKEKSVIDDFDFKVEEFIMNLAPIAYRRTGEGDNGVRIHMGFGAQDVADTINKLGIGDMSIVQASIIEEDEIEIRDMSGHSARIMEKIEHKYRGEEIEDAKLSWGLNYNEFIAPIVLMLQHQQRKIEELENKLVEKED